MEKPMKQYEVFQWASLFLQKHHRESKVAEILLQHHLNMSRSAFFANMQEEVPNQVVQQFCENIKTHATTGIPVQHLTGYEFFYGYKFDVNEHVLIPRPETEELVQHVVKVVQDSPENRPITIADIGTGSGIIACTLARELDQGNATIYATDISEAALTTAEKNAKRLGANVTFFLGDFLQPLKQKQIKVDILVSNPPYIAKSEEAFLADTVKSFDPKRALYAADNGLQAFKKIISDLPYVLNDNGYVMFEIGHQQGRSVYSLLKKVYPKSAIQIIKDINGKDRIISAKTGTPID